MADFFDSANVAKASKILNYVMENPHSSFYRNKYSDLVSNEINDYEDFKKLPLLKKDEVISVPLEERIMIPPSMITGYKFTSGTTSNNKPTILPEDQPETYWKEIENYVYDEEFLYSIGASKTLVLYPMTWVSLKILALPKKKTFTIAGNFGNLDLTAHIMKETGLNGIMTSSTALINLVYNLKKIDFDFSIVRFIALSAEFCSNPKFNFFKKLFPNAYITSRYGNAETGLRGFRCHHLSGLNPNFYHLRDDIFLEIEDPDEEGFGEIIHTDLYERSFPFIRYKTGDIGRLSALDCECGRKIILELGGRKDLDQLKFNGIMLHTKTIDNALEAIYDYVEPQFQMHAYEKRVKAAVEPYFELYLKLKDRFLESENDPKFREMLENSVSSALYLTDKLTLKELEQKGFVLPLKIIFKDTIESGFKTKSIISHLND